MIKIEELQDLLKIDDRFRWYEIRFFGKLVLVCYTQKGKFWPTFVRLKP